MMRLHWTALHCTALPACLAHCMIITVSWLAAAWVPHCRPCLPASAPVSPCLAARAASAAHDPNLCCLLRLLRLLCLQEIEALDHEVANKQERSAALEEELAALHQSDLITLAGE